MSAIIKLHVLDYHSKPKTVICRADEREEILSQFQYRVVHNEGAVINEDLTHWLDKDGCATSKLEELTLNQRELI